MNLAFLAKIARRIISDPSSFPGQIFTAKYEKGKGWWNDKLKTQSSFAWESIKTFF